MAGLFYWASVLLRINLVQFKTTKIKTYDMKKIYSLLACLLLAGSVSMAQNQALPLEKKAVNTEKQAQTAVIKKSERGYNQLRSESEQRGGLACALNEDFESGFPGGWNNITNNANENWTYETTGGNPDGHMDIAYDLASQNESIITGVIDFTTIPNPTLKFDWFMSYYWGVDPNDNYDLTISISENGINWTELWTETDFGGEFDSYTWYTTNLDLSAYAAVSSAVLRFNYNGADGAQAKFDNISVCTAQNDLRVTSVLMGDIINDYAYSQIPVSQAAQIISGVIFTNAGGTTLSNVSVDSETFSFVNNANVSAGTIAGPVSMAPGQNDTVWVATGYTPNMIDTLAQFFTLTADQTDVTPLDNEDLQIMLVTADTWAHDYELEDYYAFGYESGGALGSQGFEMGATYYCQTSGGTIYAVDFPLGSATTAQTITVNIYEGALATGLVSSTLYDILPGDLSTTAVNFINVALDVPVPMTAGNVYTATIAIEAGDDAFILGNNFDDGDGGHVIYQASNSTWYNWTGLTTAMRLRVSSVVGVNEAEAFDGFEVYPNPTSENLTINFVSKEDQLVTLNMISATGAIVYSTAISAVTGQTNQTTLNAKNLASGIYSVQLVGNSTSEVQRVVVQ